MASELIIDDNPQHRTRLDDLWANDHVVRLEESTTSSRSRASSVRSAQTASPPSSMAGAGAAIGAAAVGALGSILGSGAQGGLNLLANNANVELGSQELKLKRDAWEKEWSATQQAGLYHPSQFGLTSGLVGRSYGRRVMPTLRAPTGSTFR